MLRRCFAAGLLLVLTTSWAGAQSIDEPAWEMEFKREGGNSNKDEPDFFIQDHRGRLLVLYFWRTNNLESTEELKDMSQTAKDYAEAGVRVMSLCCNSKESYDDWIKDQQNLDLSGFHNEHVWNARVIQAQYGAVAEPLVVLIDPDGILRWRGHPNDDLDRRIERMLELYPPPSGDESKLNAMLRESEKLLDKKELGRAYTIAKQVSVYANEGNAMNARAQTLMTKLEGEADKWLKEAIRLEQDRKWDEAAKIVAEISVRFDDKKKDEKDKVQVAQDALQEIGRMNGRREMKDAIREATRRAEAQVLFDKAMRLEEQNRYADALEIYEDMLIDFEEAEDVERDVKREIIRIARDKEIGEIIAQNRARQMADSYLDIGERYARNRMYTEARDAYETLLKEYPKSEAAKVAKEALKDLPRG